MLEVTFYFGRYKFPAAQFRTFPKFKFCWFFARLEETLDIKNSISRFLCFGIQNHYAIARFAA